MTNHRHVFVGPGRMGAAMARAMQSLDEHVAAAYAVNVASPASLQFRELTGVPVYSLDLDESRVLLGAPTSGESWPKPSGQTDTGTAHQMPDSHSIFADADVVWLTVPDKAVTPVAQTLVERGWLRERQLVVHMAGSMSHEALEPAANIGAQTLCMHPLQTVANPKDSPALFQSVYFTLDGDERAIQTAKHWIYRLQGKAAVLQASQRAAYHAAAVLASNAVVALASVAADLSGIPEGLEALLPLMQGAMQNLSRMGLPNALTGPVDRNDEPTILKHLLAVQHNPTAQSVYAALGKATADVARSKGSLTESEWAHFQHLFDATLGGMSK